MLSDVLSVIYIFWFVSGNRVGFNVFYSAALRMQKIAADKVNIMECDPESTSVTIKCFSKI